MKSSFDHGSFVMCLGGAVIFLIGAVGEGLGRSGSCYIILAGVVMMVDGILSQNLEKK